MPCIKKRTQTNSIRDYWGDENIARKFDRLIDQKFGSHFGARKIAISTLAISRRVLNMYCTGERAIPDDLLAAVRALPDYGSIKAKIAPTGSKPPASAKRAPSTLYIDDIDPLS